MLRKPWEGQDFQGLQDIGDIREMKIPTNVICPGCGFALDYVPYSYKGLGWCAQCMDSLKIAPKYERDVRVRKAKQFLRGLQNQ